MTDIPPQYRYEIKFVSALHEKHRFDAWMRFSSANFRETYSERIVNNIYFDSLNMRDYYDNVIGLANRMKTRVRWYDQTCAPSSLLLEHKIKRGRISKKEALLLEGLDFSRTTWSELADRLRARASERSSMAAGNFMNPTLRNTYRRRYFETQDRRVRMTVDSDLTFYEVVTGLHVVALGAGLCVNGHIAEFKSDPRYADDLQHILRDIPLRMSRFSKYVVGLDFMRIRGEAPLYESG